MFCISYKQCPKQSGVVECGYYVMRYMREIILSGTTSILDIVRITNSYKLKLRIQCFEFISPSLFIDERCATYILTRWHWRGTNWVGRVCGIAHVLRIGFVAVIVVGVWRRQNFFLWMEYLYFVAQYRIECICEIPFVELKHELNWYGYDR